MKAKYQDGAFIGYEPTVKTVATIDGDADAISAMIDRMDGAFLPATEDQTELWLAELDLIAPRRASSTTDDDLRLRAYVSRLAPYPADVVREALLSRTWRFFPSWAELKDVCDELTAHRRAVRSELQRKEAKLREKELRARALPTEATSTLTREEADARRAAAANLADQVLAKMRANVAAEDAAARARAEDAAASYARFRPEVKE